MALTPRSHAVRDGKVTVDGNNGLVTVGDATKGAVSIGNQTVEGTKTDGTTDSQSGKYVTVSTTRNGTANTGIVEDRAATEGQLKDVATASPNRSATSTQPLNLPAAYSKVTAVPIIR